MHIRVAERVKRPDRRRDQAVTIIVEDDLDVFSLQLCGEQRIRLREAVLVAQVEQRDLGASHELVAEVVGREGRQGHVADRFQRFGSSPLA